MTMTRSYGKKVDVELDVYSECKYEAAQFGHEEVFENCKKVRYSGVEKWEIIDGEEAELIEAETDESGIDDYHEYLVLYFGDGETATFRNSYVDMFRAF